MTPDQKHQLRTDLFLAGCEAYAAADWDTLESVRTKYTGPASTACQCEGSPSEDVRAYGVFVRNAITSILQLHAERVRGE